MFYGLIKKIDITNIFQKKHVSAVRHRFMGVGVGKNLKKRIFSVFLPLKIFLWGPKIFKNVCKHIL